MLSNGLILALLVAKGFEEDVGPMGGEDPEVIKKDNGAELRLTSQGPDTVYKFNDDGSVDEVFEGTKEKFIDGLISVGYDEEDAEDVYNEGPHHYDTVLDLLDDQDRSTWFLYFQDEHPDLYDAIDYYLGELKAREVYENSEN